ncbi:Purine nucleoside phosphoramidase [Thalassocella blandensis]|nr:Purine nucleoside phosphoramidase [Thalassocella blandensis]
MSEETIFTKIINGQIPSEILFQDDLCICIKDIQPKAPTHVLLIPKKPIPRLVDATQEDAALLGHLMVKAGDIAKSLGVGDAFRLVINNGEQAGQTVFHLHMHILGDKTFTEGSLGM